MSTNPINLAVRFLLEITTLFASGYWGFKMHSGFMKYVWMIGLPLFMAAIWGIFAVAGDPSRSGKTVIPTPGLIRLIVELGYFGFGAWAIYMTGQKNFALIFALVCIIHYLISYDRIMWLLKQ